MAAVKSILGGSENPTLLTLLECGARVEFPDGRYIVGERRDGYIRIGYGGDWFGLYILNRDGLSRAHADRDWRECVTVKDNF